MRLLMRVHVMIAWWCAFSTLLLMVLAKWLAQFRDLLFPRSRPHESTFGHRHGVELVRIQHVALLPLHQRVEVAAFAIDAKIWPRNISILHPCERQHLCIAVTLDILQDDINAMAEMDPPHSVVNAHIRRIARIVCKGSFSQQVQAVNLLIILV